MPEQTPILIHSNNPNYTAVTDNDEPLFVGPEPTFIGSFKFIITSTWLNVLLVFIPIGFLAHFLHWPDVAVFFINFVALVPLAKILGTATEEIALRTNETLGGLLNATFGNAIELILSLVALSKGLVNVVQASLLGSLLSNLLFVMGFAFLMGGIYHKEQKFNSTAAQTGASLLTMTAMSWVVPAVFSSVTGPEYDGLVLTLSRATSIILLIIYGFYITFQLYTHKHLFESEEEHEQESPSTSLYGAIAILIISTGIIAACSEFLVGSIEGLSLAWGLSETFVGVILLPIVGNAAEHLTAVTVAMKNKMDLSIGIGLGSSMQIALLVTPFCVIVGWIMNVNMSLNFSTFETSILFVTVFVVNSLISDGTCNWLEGVMLLASYLLIGASFYLIPESALGRS